MGTHFERAGRIYRYASDTVKGTVPTIFMGGYGSIEPIARGSPPAVHHVLVHSNVEQFLLPLGFGVLAYLVMGTRPPQLLLLMAIMALRAIVEPDGDSGHETEGSDQPEAWKEEAHGPLQREEGQGERYKQG